MRLTFVAIGLTILVCGMTIMDASNSSAQTSRSATTTSAPEEWLPLVKNSTLPPPEVPPLKFPTTGPQASDGEAEAIHRAAIAWFDQAIAEVDKLVPAAEAAADKIIAGGNFYVSGSPGFIAEVNGRAGGFAFTQVWDGKKVNPGDVLMIGQLNPQQEGPLNAGLSNVIRGDGSVSKGRVVHISSHNWTLPKDMKGHINPERWDNNRLTLIDTRAPAGETLREAAIGQMATCAMAWAFQGEMFAAGTRKGKTLVTYASIFEPYGMDWFKLFQGEKLHTRYNVPPIEAGKIARDYFRTCQWQLNEFFEHRQERQYQLAAGRLAGAIKRGNTIWTVPSGHVLVNGAIIPPDLGKIVMFGKDYDWKVSYLNKGDVLLRPAYFEYPKGHVEEVLAAGGEAVTFAIEDGPTEANRTHLQTYWKLWDGSVNVPDYPVRILPVTGVEQLVQWYSLMAETQKAVKK